MYPGVFCQNPFARFFVLFCHLNTDTQTMFYHEIFRKFVFFERGVCRDVISYQHCIFYYNEAYSVSKPAVVVAQAV